MIDVLRDMIHRLIFVYIVDILIFFLGLRKTMLSTCTWTGHLDLLLDSRLFVKAQKCEFHSPSASFLWFIIAKEQDRADPAKIQAVTEWVVPSTCKLAQHFWGGFANFYRCFIKNYTRVGVPFIQLTLTVTPHVWTSEAYGAFTRLRSRFSFTPDPSIVEVDASDSGVGPSLS